jgi:hypothetical protein
MSKKIEIDLMEIDKKAGKHWLAPLTKDELALRREAIRKKNLDKYLEMRRAQTHGEPPPSE